MSTPPAPDDCDDKGGLFGYVNCATGTASNSEGQTGSTLLAAISGSFASFGVQLLIFLVLRVALKRIYRPRTYLVPERERVPPPPSGYIGWIAPLFTTPNLAFIQKCGLDAYFFLRYLRMLLKIFVPLAIIIMPILLPINHASGNSDGLDRLSISNVGAEYRKTRLWAHCLLALLAIAWVCYVVYRELRGYIRVRQAYLTSPQHRIRASATTVLVTGIPRKWLTLEALMGLYDVFPGGIRNIWINRNFDDLATKVTYRDALATSLEDAETVLIKKCWRKHRKAEKKRLRAEGGHHKSKKEKKQEKEAADAAADQLAQGHGTSAGDQHDVRHNLSDALREAGADDSRKSMHNRNISGSSNPFGAMHGGFDAIGQGLGKFGKNIGNFGRNVTGNVDNGIHNAAGGFNQAGTTGAGFVTDDELYRQSLLVTSEHTPTPPAKADTGLSAETGETRASFRKTSEPFSNISEHRSPQPHPLAVPAEVPGEQPHSSHSSEDTQVPRSSSGANGASVENGPRSQMQIELPESHLGPPRKKWQVWKNNDEDLVLPSPQPHTVEEDSFPLRAAEARDSNARDLEEKPDQRMSTSKWHHRVFWWRKDDGEDKPPKEEYPKAHNSDNDEDQDEEPAWRRFLGPKDRETYRVPLWSPTWCPSLPWIGKKVDRIYYLRRELARMNLEIETDQNDVEKFPFMNSAFIQFNHQVAAHMCCQSLSHHVPQQMAPRTVEISPDDVLWENMSIKWWERYLRTFMVLAICAGLVVLFALPVTFTTLLSNVSALADKFPAALGWLADFPDVAISIIQGLLPPILLAVILAVMPMIFRFLVGQQGVPTGNAREMGVQKWYFAFLFIQVFLVATITGGLSNFIASATSPDQIVTTLAQSLPQGANYYFSYLLVQGLSNSASNLLQVAALAAWFLLGPMMDSTARAKWRRQTTLAKVEWGRYFPFYANFAVIGIVYSVIAPLMFVFLIIIFSLFWLVYRHNVLYVYQFRNDTGGLLFPVAVNQLFTGIYVLELCLVGFFFIAVGPDGNVVCIPQAIIMIVALVATLAYQYLLNAAFKPLFRYLPITLEDEAVIRDEQFARAQAGRFAPLNPSSTNNLGEDDEDDDADDTRDIQHILEAREQKELDAEAERERLDQLDADDHRRTHTNLARTNSITIDQAAHSASVKSAGRTSWHQRSRQNSAPQSAGASPALDPRQTRQTTWKTDRLRGVRNAYAPATDKIRTIANTERAAWKTSGKDASAAPASQLTSTDADASHVPKGGAAHAPGDPEAQREVGELLFAGFADELEDLTPEERDVLVRYAFQHSALRAKRPVVWIPRDRLGVSDDEIRRAKRMSTVDVGGKKDGKKGAKGTSEGKKDGEKGGKESDGERDGEVEAEKTLIWMSNEGTAIDGSGKVVFRRSPPDFSAVDLIAL